jgi:hypothetical protein
VPSSGRGIDLGSISPALALMVFEMLVKLVDVTLEKKRVVGSVVTPSRDPHAKSVLLQSNGSDARSRAVFW